MPDILLSGSENSAFTRSVFLATYLLTHDEISLGQIDGARPFASNNVNSILRAATNMDHSKSDEKWSPAQSCDTVNSDSPIVIFLLLWLLCKEIVNYL